jgi:hypothetical protein
LIEYLLGILANSYLSICHKLKTLLRWHSVMHVTVLDKENLTDVFTASLHCWYLSYLAIMIVCTFFQCRVIHYFTRKSLLLARVKTCFPVSWCRNLYDNCICTLGALLSGDSHYTR